MLIGVVVALDDADIVAATVRRNLRFLDKIVLVEGGSVDGTAEVLRGLSGDPAVDVVSAVQGHSSPKLVMQVLRGLDALADVSHAIILHGCDCLLGEPEAFRQALSGDDAWAISRDLHVPHVNDDWGQPDPILRIGHRLEGPVAGLEGLVVPRRLFQTMMLQGLSRVWTPEGEVPRLSMPSNVARMVHYPVRSAGRLALGLLTSPGAEWPGREAPTADRMALWALAKEQIARGGQAPKRADPACVNDGATEPEPDLLQAILSIPETKVGPERSSTGGGLLDPRAAHLGVVHGRHGAFLVPKADAVIGRALEVYGEWAEYEVGSLLRRLMPGDVVVDVGANLGCHTVPFAAAVGPEGRVHAFEPQRRIFQLLCANIALNGLPNVEAHHAAIGPEAGFVDVPDIPLSVVRNIGGLDLRDRVGGETTRLMTIDQLELPKLRLLKVDVEGMEHQVLSGGRSTIDRCKPIIYVENNVEENSHALILLMESMGYKIWWHVSPYFNISNYFGAKKDIFSEISRPEINLLGLHGSAPESLASPSWMKGAVMPVADADDSWTRALSRAREAAVAARSFNS